MLSKQYLSCLSLTDETNRLRIVPIRFLPEKGTFTQVVASSDNHARVVRLCGNTHYKLS